MNIWWAAGGLLIWAALAAAAVAFVAGATRLRRAHDREDAIRRALNNHALWDELEADLRRPS